MVANQHFIANDYLRAFDLKNIFHKYVVIYTNLHFTDGEPLSNKVRQDLTLQLEATLNELSIHVLKMKESKRDKEEANTSMPYLTGPQFRGNECRMAN